MLTAYEPPSGPGVRVDGYGYAGYAASPNYDSLLAKVIARGADPGAAAAARTARALAEFRIEGVETNLALLRALLAEPDVARRARRPRASSTTTPPSWSQGRRGLAEPRLRARRAPPPGSVRRWPKPSPGAEAGQRAPLQATVGLLEVGEGDLVRAGQTVAILEAMKMEHVVAAPIAGRVATIAAAKGEVVAKDQPILFIAPEEVERDEADDEATVDLDHIRPDLAEALERWRMTRDEARPEAVARRRDAISAPPGRTSTTWSIRAPSSNTAPSPWPPSVVGARWTSS